MQEPNLDLRLTFHPPLHPTSIALTHVTATSRHPHMHILRSYTSEGIWPGMAGLGSGVYGLSRDKSQPSLGVRGG